MSAFPTPAAMARMLSGLLRSSRTATLEQLPSLVAAHAGAAGLAGARFYLADLQQDVLREVTGRGLDAGEGGQELRIDGSVAGRAFQSTDPVAAPVVADRRQWWLPVMDGTERVGVLSVEVPSGPESASEAMLALADLIGLLLVSKRAHSDSFARLTRTRPMSVAAEMQWSLMPPMTFANQRVAVSAMMEPAYEIAGDAFDYAEAGDVVHLAIFDAMGHDTAAGLTANLAVAACRSHRRRNASLQQAADAIEHALIEQFSHSRYATGILADLDTSTGELTWLNCGHHPPVLIREGTPRVLDCRPSGPLGTGLGLDRVLCREKLARGDRILLYTDGITEARDAAGREFGLERFTDFVIRHQAQGMPVPETLRRLVHAVLDYHPGGLQDDATVLFCEWNGTAYQLLQDPSPEELDHRDRGDHAEHRDHGEHRDRGDRSRPPSAQAACRSSARPNNRA
jgi:stage II sporulation SpoE-like protein